MNLDNLKNKALQELKEANDAKALEQWRVKYLGRKGEVTKILRSLGEKSLQEKQLLGPQANQLRKNLEDSFREIIKLSQPRSKSGFDITMPGKKVAAGHLHPLTKVENEIKKIFSGLNFSVVEGPEIETEYYNFDALNFPPNHPARELWDTFWLEKEGRNRHLLRCHTSPMQIHYMENHQPPFQIIVPGRCFRPDATDASHETNFHQFEGLMVGHEVSLANFKFIITEFFKKFYNKPIEVRFRPSYFPFVEPGVEVDIKMGGGWLEMMGAGMVHPNVFKAVGYDPKKVRGFAFGAGIERLAMIKYNIPDIRLFYSSDLRFIKQF